MTHQYRTHIVGARHHPPALAILDYLPYNAPLILRAQPDNPFDSNAIQVWVKSEIFDCFHFEPEFDDCLSQFGYNTKELKKERMWQLGYVPCTVAEELTNRGFPISHDVKGEYYFGSDGKPRVSFSL